MESDALDYRLKKGPKMHLHRFRDRPTAETREQATPVSMTGFMVCPAALAQGWQGQNYPWEQVYRLAYEKAQAAGRPAGMPNRSWLQQLQADLLN